MLALAFLSRWATMQLGGDALSIWRFIGSGIAYTLLVAAAAVLFPGLLGMSKSELSGLVKRFLKRKGTAGQ